MGYLRTGQENETGQPNTIQLVHGRNNIHRGGVAVCQVATDGGTDTMTCLTNTGKIMIKNTLSRPEWDDWFMGMCFWVSLRSPDPSTKHGAVLCNNRHQILGVGYNGFPRGCKDSELPLTRPLKYGYMVHAEDNCLMNSQNLLLGDGYTMYVTGFPCLKCFTKIMQSGVRKVVYGPLTSRCVQKDVQDCVTMLSQSGNTQIQKYQGKFECLKNIDIFKGLLQMPPNG